MHINLNQKDCQANQKVEAKVQFKIKALNNSSSNNNYYNYRNIRNKIINLKTNNNNKFNKNNSAIHGSKIIK